MIQNPSFQEAGVYPGQAANWKLRTMCRAERIAGFGPSPSRPEEDFERWFEFQAVHQQDKLVMAVFAGAGEDGFEESWNEMPFLVELSEAQLEAYPFDNGDEDMETGWLEYPFAMSTEELTLVQGDFEGKQAEDFAGWYPPTIPEWTSASFDNHTNSNDRFEGTWPSMTTI